MPATSVHYEARIIEDEDDEEGEWEALTNEEGDAIEGTNLAEVKVEAIEVLKERGEWPESLLRIAKITTKYLPV
jgi:hypothetical protein